MLGEKENDTAASAMKMARTTRRRESMLPTPSSSSGPVLAGMATRYARLIERGTRI